MKRTYNNTRPSYKQNKMKSLVFQEMYKVGFKQSYISKWLKPFDDSIWSDYHKFYSVNHVIDDLILELDCDIDDILDGLRKKYRLKYSLIVNNLKDHFGTIHLAQIIFEYAKGLYDPISTNVFLFQHENESVWFEQYFEGTKLSCYNAVDNKDVKEAIKSLSSANKLFYHATSWKFHNDIMRYGPSHETGRKCLDFGINRSFYLTPDLDSALDWATRERFNNEGCIIVFSLNIDLFKKAKTFNGPNDEWKHLVKISRMCEVPRNELDNYNFVYGPMLKNISQIRTSEAQPHFPYKWQLASKSDSSDRFLKKNIVGTIFLKKQQFT